MKKPNIAVIGCGYWGPNLIRNFDKLDSCNMKMCCDLSSEKLSRLKKLYSHIEFTPTLEDILTDSEIDGVAIATPVFTHAEIGKKCLEHGKHVLIEKPLATTSKDVIELINIAKKQEKILMTGHTFLYTAAVNKTKEIVDSGELGEIHYISAVRVNLGLFQPDINVIWDLAPHDISIILAILGEMPESVNAQGKAHYSPKIEDVATVSLNFSNGAIAFLHNSWLDPDKIRKITVVGSKKMLVYDDISQNEKIKIYDKGVEAPPYYDSYAEFHYSYRYGDIYTPRLNEYEPLQKECNHFIDSIITGKTPISDGYNGLQVISILEATDKSLRNSGASQLIDKDILT